MDRTQDDIRVTEKVWQIVREKLPGFAVRYFRHNVDLMVPRSLYGYARDLASFFEYLETVSFTTSKMQLKDLDQVTPAIVENYLDYSKIYTVKGITKERSLNTLARRYSTLSSFFKYYYSLDLIDKNPVSKVVAPANVRNRTSIPSNEITLEMLNYVTNEELGGRKDYYRTRTKERDLAIILLILGAGVKASDVVSLNIEDLHLEDNYIIVRSRKRTRTVFISDTISRALSEYLVKRLDITTVYGDDSALFLSLQCKRMCLRAVEKMINKYSSVMFDGRDHLTPEALTQSFRNNVLKQTNDLTLTSTVCGISKNAVLSRYRAYIDQYTCQEGTGFHVPPIKS